MASGSLCGGTFAGTSASDLLRSSANGISGVPLRNLGRERLGFKRREFTVSAKVKKVKKREYPWPKDPDPNVKGGVLSHLSHFKPLEEKQKPVFLDFEKALIELEKKIIDVRKMASETGLDFTDQITLLETKYEQALKDLYTHLTPIQRVSIARHPNRPTFLDHVFNITEKFVELHGDRSGYDDPAIVTGLGSIDGRTYMFIGHQKGRNTKENIKRNFGMPTPHGYRKALQKMRYADHHGFPIVTFIDTPGAYADLKSEEKNQGEAIAHNLREMFGLKVPIVSIVIGEGGSGGALAIGCGNKLLMLENAVFYVASPEACAAILWKTAKASPKAAEKLRITAPELCKLEVADGIIPEPTGGAHADPSWVSQQIKVAINEAMDELSQMSTDELLNHRMFKFRKIGASGCLEGVLGRNMKKRELPVAKNVPDAKLNIDDVKKMRQQILRDLESSTKLPELDMDETIQKLRKEVDREYTEAAKAMGLTDKLAKLREEISKGNLEDQLLRPEVKDKIEKLKEEFNHSLSKAPNYGRLKEMLDMLAEFSQAKVLFDKNKKAAKLKKEFKVTYEDVINNPSIKKKYEKLKEKMESVGGSSESSFSDLDDELKNELIEFKKEVELKLVDALKSKGLEVDIVREKAQDVFDNSVSESESEIGELNNDISKEIEIALNSSDLKSKIDILKIEVAKVGNSPDLASKNRIAALEQQIKKSLVGAIDSTGLKEKYENLTSKTSREGEFSGESNGSLKSKYSDGGIPTNDKVRMEVGANGTFS